MDRPKETPEQEAERLKVEITGKEIIKKFFLQHAQPAEANEPEPDQEAPAGKTAKKNRKEKERRARRKKEERESRASGPAGLEEKCAEITKLEIGPAQSSQPSLSSSPPASAGRTPRLLMKPAVPFKLQFGKKYTNTEQTISPSPHPEESRSRAQPTVSDTEGAGIALAVTEMADSSSSAPPKEAEKDVSPQALTEGSISPAQITSQDVEEAESAHSSTTITETAPVVSDADQKQTIPASPTSESSESAPVASAADQKQNIPASPTQQSSKSAEATAALPSLSIQTSHPEIPASGPSDDTAASHAHPSIPTPAQGPANPPPQPRLIQFDTYEWLCRNQKCRKVTSPWDGSTVICPRCGPYSKIRYCSKKCLFDDILMHWGIDCGQHTLTQRADPLTIHPRQVRIHPFIPSLTHHDRPERHRQLIRHSVDTAADYFIFSDWVDWRGDGFPGDWPANKHASGSILVALDFTENGSSVPSRHFFTRLLHICFLVGGVRTDMTYYLFKMIRGRLNELGLATEDVKNCLVWQFKHEFAYGGGFAELLEDERVISWPVVAGQIVRLEAPYRSFLFGGAGLGPEWTNKV